MPLFLSPPRLLLIRAASILMSADSDIVITAPWDTMQSGVNMLATATQCTADYGDDEEYYGVHY